MAQKEAVLENRPIYGGWGIHEKYMYQKELNFKFHKFRPLRLVFVTIA